MNTSLVCTNCFKLKGNNKICPYCGKAGAELSSEAYHLLPGTVLQNRYLIGQTLGFGGFGVIYKAFDLTLGIVVAIKEFFPVNLVCRLPGEKTVTVFSGDRETEFEKGLNRFEDEARKMASFGKCPDIVDILGFFKENRTAYIIMEFLDGISLDQYIKSCGGKIPVDEAVEILQHVLQGLNVLHNGGIIHRDINPKNIFITVDNKIKIIDFGAAKYLGDNIDNDGQDNVVTEGYAPPEQYQKSEAQGTYTDIYAAGATLYRAITGVTPVNSLDRRRDDPLVYPSKMISGVPENIDIAIMKAMAYKSEYRFMTAGDFAEALELANNGYDYPEAEEHRRFIRKVLAAVSSLIAVVVAVAVILTATQSDKLFGAMKNIIEDSETITVYIPYEDSLDETKEKYLKISEDFSDYSKKYYEKNLKVAYEFVSADKYAKAVNEASDGSRAACVFRNDVSSDITIRKYDLSALLEDIKDDYLFYDQITESDSLPMGINVYELYANKTAKSKSLQVIESWSDYLSNAPSKELLCVSNGGYSALYRSLTDSNANAQTAYEVLMRTLNNGKLQSSNAFKTNFLNKQSSYFIGSLNNKNDIENSDICLTYQTVDFPGGEGIGYGVFVDEWCVSDAVSESQKSAAVLFLRYLSGDECQANLSLSRNSISGNKKILKSQAETYGGVFEKYRLSPGSFSVDYRNRGEAAEFEEEFINAVAKSNNNLNKVKENVLKLTEKYF